MDLINDAKSTLSLSNSVKMFDLNRDDGYVDDDDIKSNNTEKSISNEEFKVAFEQQQQQHEEKRDGLEEYDADNEPIDPRIQIELEKLNRSSGDVNKLENELDELKTLFVNTKNKQAQRIEFLQKKLGNCVSKSKPYYDALAHAMRLQIETQRAVIEFQKAMSHYKTAKETLAVAEENLTQNGKISDVWQEYLSEAITKIGQCKRLADQAEDYHRTKALEYQLAERNVQLLEKDFKKIIAKSKPYYEEKERWQMQMEAQKSNINQIETALHNSKRVYSEAMNKLRDISDEIHLSRRRHRFNSNPRERNQKLDSDYKEALTKSYKQEIEESQAFKHQTKSLNDIVKACDCDSHDELHSLDTISVNSTKSTADEKRTQYALNKQQKLEYFSFTQSNIDCSTTPQSRSQSPLNFDKTLQSTNNDDENALTPRPTLNDSGKYSCSIESQSSVALTSPLSKHVNVATTPSTRLKIAQEQETPLLTNLLLYNNDLMNSQLPASHTHTLIYSKVTKNK